MADIDVIGFLRHKGVDGALLAHPEIQGILRTEEVQHLAQEVAFGGMKLKELISEVMGRWGDVIATAQAEIAGSAAAPGPAPGPASEPAAAPGASSDGLVLLRPDVKPADLDAHGFDATYYLEHNPDVAAAGVNPLDHFLSSGWREGRDPNALFDVSYYLSHNKDVAAAGINPLEHYMNSGWHEGRAPSAVFDGARYLADNPDVAAAGINPLEHLLESGLAEGRAMVPADVWG